MRLYVAQPVAREKNSKPFFAKKRDIHVSNGINIEMFVVFELLGTGFVFAIFLAAFGRLAGA